MMTASGPADGIQAAVAMANAFIVARQEASYDELQSQQIPAFDEMHSMTQPHCDDVAYDGKGPVEAHADPPETGVRPSPGLASTAPDSASRDLRPRCSLGLHCQLCNACDCRCDDPGLGEVDRLLHHLTCM